MEARNRRGGVLIEAVIALQVFLLATVLNLELVLRARLEVLVRQGAFLFARSRALGLSSTDARRQLDRFLLEGGLGKEAVASIQVEETWRARELVVAIHHRFRQILSFPRGKQTKHHFQMKRVCRFPLSS